MKSYQKSTLANLPLGRISASRSQDEEQFLDGWANGEKQSRVFAGEGASPSFLERGILLIDSSVRCFADDDGFGETIVGALVVGIQEVLQEAEAAFQGGSAVAEASFDRLPEGEARVREGDDTDSEQSLTGRPAIREAEEEAEIEDDPQGPEDFEGHFHAEFDLDACDAVGNVVEVFSDVQLLLDEVLEGCFHGSVGEGENGEVDGDRQKAAAKGGERRAFE